MSKNIIIGIIIVAVVLVVGLLFSMPRTLGGLVHNTIENFVNGLQVGSADHGGCIKMQDYDTGGYTYIYSVNGTVSSATSAPFAGACGGQ